MQTNAKTCKFPKSSIFHLDALSKLRGTVPPKSSNIRFPFKQTVFFGKTSSVPHFPTPL